MNNTKKSIFDSAIIVFSKDGYDSATMDEISQKAGVAKGTLYYHFKSKEEIFNFIIKEGMKTIKERAKDMVDSKEDALDKLKAFCKMQLNFVYEYKDFFKVVMSQLWGENSRHMELRNAISEYLMDIEGYLKAAMDNGLIKKGDLFFMSCNIMGAVCSLAIHNIIKNDSINTEDEIDKMMEYILEGIKI